MACGKILVVEPEPHARVALRELLLDEGYEVLVVPDMADVAAMVAFAPHVALVDAAQLESDASVRLLAEIAPVSLVMSLRDAPAFGADLVHKPIDIPQLFVKVAGAMERAMVRGRPRPGGSE